MGMKSFGLKHALLVGAAALGLGTAAAAPSPAYAQEALRSYDIPPQDLDDALREFGRQTGRDVLFTPVSVAGRRSGALNGQMTERQALESLLAGSGLRFEQTASGGYAVQDPNSPTRLDDAAGAASSDEGATADILVVGRRTLNADIRRTEDDAQPYIVIDREDIERSGASNVEELFRQSLAAATDFQPLNQNLFSEPRGSVSLRGLGTDETLILVDGRRLTQATITGNPDGQPDINGIPLAAIERIEVLPATASGIYGGGATGGVINIVLRRDYHGLEAALRYENAFEGDAARISGELSGGFSLEDGRTSVMLSVAHTDSEQLLVGDRNFSQRYIDAVLANNPSILYDGFLPPLGFTTNIRTLGGEDLTLVGGPSLGSNIAFVPLGYAGPDSDGGLGLLAGAGQYNLDLANTPSGGGRRTPLVSTPSQTTLSGSIRREFAPWLDVFVDGSYSRSVVEEQSDIFGWFMLFPGDPGNPFNEAISVMAPLVGSERPNRSELTSQRVSAGAIFDLPADWRGLADYSWSSSEYTFSGSNLSTDSAALNAGVSSGALDIFSDLNAHAANFAPYFLDPGTLGPATTEMSSISFRASGGLPFSLPGGTVTASVLIEHREQALNGFFQIVPQFGIAIAAPDREQIVDGAYAEVLAPIVSEHQNIPFINLLELQLAGRWDQYETTSASLVVQGDPFTYSTNQVSDFAPTIGLRFSPFSGLIFRGSYGEGFLPPSVQQIVEQAPQSTFLPVTDPLRGDELIGNVVVQYGGNPELTPESSESWSVGIVFSGVPNLRFSADWTHIEKSDAILDLNVSSQAEFEALLTNVPENITRGPVAPGDPYGVGPITFVRSTSLNFSSATIEALDLNVDYELQTTFGLLEFRVNATHLETLDTQSFPNAPIIHQAGSTGNLEWRANTSVTWSLDKWSATWTSRYYDSYLLLPEGIADFATGISEVPDQIYHDISVRRTFDVANREVQLQLGATNILGEEPPLDPFVANRYSPFGDPRVSTFYVGLRASY